MTRLRIGRIRAAILVILAVLGIWAFVWEPRRLVVREARIDLPCWQAKPLRIALVSDLHIGSPFVGLEKLDRVVAALNGGHADIIVLLGDFVIQDVIGGHFVAPEQTAKKLGTLRAPLGVYAVLGNHDWWLDGPRVARALRTHRVNVIDDTSMKIGGAFWLAGISDFMEGKHDVALALKSVIDAAPVLAMTHNPDVFPLVPPRVCLTLAGHTHGGQVALPLVGRPIVPSIYRQRYAIGHIQEHGRHLFVTSGVGTSIIPVRFRVPPEVVFLTLSHDQRMTNVQSESPAH